MKFERLTALGLLAGLTLTFSGVVKAQDEGANRPHLSDVWIMIPKAGHSAELESAIKAHGDARKAAGDPRNWHIYTPVLADDMSPFVARYCCFDWADQDTYIEWFEGTDLLAHFNQHVGPHLAGTQHHLSAIDWDNSHWPEDSREWAYVGVTTWKPKPGEQGARNRALRKMTSTAKEKGWDNRWVFMRTLGGPADLSVVVPFDSFADMDPGEQTYYQFMVKHLGQEEASQLFQAFGSSFWSSEYTVWKLRHDLSMTPDEG